MSENKALIERQQIFVDWLKECNMYNPMESAYTMQQMFRVWEQTGIDGGFLDPLEEE